MALVETYGAGEKTPSDENERSDLLDVADLVRMFEESEESTYEARQLAERDRDYYDNKQLTAGERETLRKRGQPEVIANRIAPKINFLVGLEISQRIDPRALPRTPAHEEDADSASQALRYVADEQDYDAKRTQVWKNLILEGAGGIGVAVEPSYRDELCVKLRRYAWDRIFWDPHSAEPDFSDAAYKGVVIWQDYDEALAQYADEPGAKEALDTTLATAPSQTYDDKPKWSLWADKKRKRVRICQIWLKRGKQYYWAEFTKGGILKAGSSSYVTDQDESDEEMVFASGYVDRDNNRYGIARMMISLQDEVNKRRSKALHLLNTHQTTYEEGAVEDIEEYRRQKARPDGTMKVNPGALSEGKIISETRLDLATGQVQLLQESKNELDQIGPNATMMGEKAQGSSAASGKAIIASQQGGMMEIGEIKDRLQDLDRRVFRKIWYRIRQFWTGEKWIRVTDDERNTKWVGVNVDPMQVQMAMQENPEMQGKIAGVVGNIAELDCDIIIDEAPDSVTPALEQWEALVRLAEAGVPIPPAALVKSAPNLKDKAKLLEEMNQPNPQAQAMQQLQVKGAAAAVEKTQSETMLNMARAAHESGRPEAPGAQSAEVPIEVQTAETLASVEDKRAAALLKHRQADKVGMETALLPAKMRQDAQNAAADRQARLQQARQRPPQRA